MRKKALIVDDERTMLLLLKNQVLKVGFDAITAENGKEALQLVTREQPDIIISDVVMPEMDGFEFHQRVRRNLATENIPFIFLSAKAKPEDQLKGLRSGADDYLTKPFRLDDLLACIKRVMKKAEKAKAYRAGADFGGNLNQMPIADAVQLSEQNVQSGELVLTSSEGSTLGSVFILDGKIIDAQTHTLGGDEAFFELMGLVEGNLEFYSRSINREQRIRSSNMNLVLEANRLNDDAHRFFEMVSDQDAPFVLKTMAIPKLIQEEVGRSKLKKILSMVIHHHTARELLTSSGMSRTRAASILLLLLTSDIIEFTAKQDRITDAPPHSEYANILTPLLYENIMESTNAQLTGMLESKGTNAKAAIIFEKGRIVHAYYDKATGKKALYRIFASQANQYEFQPQPIVIEKTIEAALEDLLLEGCKEVSWKQKLTPEKLNYKLTIDSTALAQKSNIHSRPEVRTTLALIQQHSQVGRIIDASPLNDQKAYGYIGFLHKNGIIKIEKTEDTKVCIITDSTADLPEQITRNLDIVTVPLSITINDEVFLDGVNISPENFYEALKNSETFPSTSPVGEVDFDKIFGKIVVDQDFVGIFISSKMSDTYAHAKAAIEANSVAYRTLRRKNGRDSEALQIGVIDSQLVSMAMGLLVIEAAEKAAQGWNPQKITQHIERLIPQIRSFFLVNTLEFLQRGGRIGKAKAFLGSLLRLRPILGIRNGEVDVIDQVRGGKKAQLRVEELIRKDLVNMPGYRIKAAVMHADAPQWATQMHDIVKENFNCESIFISQIGPTVGAHCGPGTVAVTYYPLVD